MTLNPTLPKSFVKQQIQRENFIKYVENLNHNSKIDLKNLVRTLRPYFKTQRLKNVLFIYFKDTALYIRLELKELDYSYCEIPYFEVTSSKSTRIKYQFFPESHKDLLQKIIKHNLI